MLQSVCDSLLPGITSKEALEIVKSPKFQSGKTCRSGQVKCQS